MAHRDAVASADRARRRSPPNGAPASPHPSRCRRSSGRSPVAPRSQCLHSVPNVARAGRMSAAVEEILPAACRQLPTVVTIVAQGLSRYPPYAPRTHRAAAAFAARPRQVAALHDALRHSTIGTAAHAPCTSQGSRADRPPCGVTLSAVGTPQMPMDLDTSPLDSARRPATRPGLQLHRLPLATIQQQQQQHGMWSGAAIRVAANAAQQGATLAAYEPTMVLADSSSADAGDEQENALATAWTGYTAPTAVMMNPTQRRRRGLRLHGMDTDSEAMAPTMRHDDASIAPSIGSQAPRVPPIAASTDVHQPVAATATASATIAAAFTVPILLHPAAAMSPVAAMVRPAVDRDRGEAARPVAPGTPVPMASTTPLRACLVCASPRMARSSASGERPAALQCSDCGAGVCTRCGTSTIEHDVILCGALAAEPIASPPMRQCPACGAPAVRTGGRVVCRACGAQYCVRCLTSMVGHTPERCTKARSPAPRYPHRPQQQQQQQQHRESVSGRGRERERGHGRSSGTESVQWRLKRL